MAYDSTSFAGIQAEAVSNKVFLVEIRPAEVLTGWTLTGGQTKTYEISYLNETITLADKTTTEILRKEIIWMEENGEKLNARTSIAQVEATHSTYWHDLTNGKLYIHASGDDDPVGYTIIGYFWLWFATQGLDVNDGTNDRYYEPYVALDGIPSIRQSNPNLFWGVTQISGGKIKFLNGRGYFDQIGKKFIWTNKKVRILLGNEGFRYSAYELLYTLKITNKYFTREEFNLDVASESFNLMQSLPINKFWTSNYANLDPAAEGMPIPLYYGIYGSTHAPIVTCINSTYGVDQYQFKICDHRIQSLDEVYINYSDGNDWSTLTAANTNSTLATFTITDEDFVLGQSKVKVAFHGKCTAAGTSALEYGPDIIQDLLENVLSYDSTDLDSTAWAASTVLADAQLIVPIQTETEALSIIEKICVSDMAFFDENEDGHLRYRIWKPWMDASTYAEIDDLDFVSIPEATEDNLQIYTTVSIGYGYCCANQTYIYHDETESISEYKYNKKESLRLKTCLKNENAAIILAQRLKFLTKDPTRLWDLV